MVPTEEVGADMNAYLHNDSSQEDLNPPEK